MEELRCKISALHKVNEEIIARVEELQEVVQYDYIARHKDDRTCEFMLEEVTLNIKVSDILRDCKFEGQLVTQVWDIFNDKPNWTAKGWADLKRLNSELFAIVEKFELLDKGNLKIQDELRKYLHNFEIIQTGLGAIEQKALPQDTRQTQLAARIAEVNRMLAELKCDGVRFPSPMFGYSAIVSSEHAPTLADWYGSGWKLLFRASRDRWPDFQKRCEDKGPTVTVIRCTDGHVFGGHLEQSWKSGWITCSAATLFTLANPHKIPPTRFRVDSSACAARSSSDGPTFGNNDIHIDLALNSSYFNFPHSYQDSTGRGQKLFTGGRNFRVAELEVFGK